jgi:hypothetical protein
MRTGGVPMRTIVNRLLVRHRTLAEEIGVAVNEHRFLDSIRDPR